MLKYARNMLEICRIICKICRICTKICIKICEKCHCAKKYVKNMQNMHQSMQNMSTLWENDAICNECALKYAKYAKCVNKRAIIYRICTPHFADEHLKYYRVLSRHRNLIWIYH